MKKLMTLLCFMVVLASNTYGQFPYTFTAFKEAYKPLISGTEFKPGVIWNDGDIFSLPLSFTFKMDTVTCHNFFSFGGTGIGSDTTGLYLSALFYCFASLEDRGNLTGTIAKSPVRYEITGAPGSKILKVEIANAGFYAEQQVYGTMDDSVNVQIWVYERSNTIELRYGPSKVSHPSDYFSFGGPFVVYAKDLDTFNNGPLYILTGDPSSPGIDTVHLIAGNPDNTITTLTHWPSDSTVYRFTLNTTSVKTTTQPQLARIYPTLCHDKVIIDENTSNATLYQIIAANGMNTSIKGKLKQKQTNIIDVSSLPPGMYFVQLHSPEGNASQKIIKD